MRIGETFLGSLCDKMQLFLVKKKNNENYIINPKPF